MIVDNTPPKSIKEWIKEPLGEHGRKYPGENIPGAMIPGAMLPLFPTPPTNVYPPLDKLSDVLDERGKRYGKFDGHASITQRLKETMRATPKWKDLADDQVEALEMVAHKIGRILNGDPNYDDSWVDIAGYVKLVSDRLQGVQR